MAEQANHEIKKHEVEFPWNSKIKHAPYSKIEPLSAEKKAEKKLALVHEG
jgi:hypothetical protein